eukprot:4264372-Pleurochrysis_carterae.AAC.1
MRAFLHACACACLEERLEVGEALAIGDDAKGILERCGGDGRGFAAPRVGDKSAIVDGCVLEGDGRAHHDGRDGDEQKEDKQCQVTRGAAVLLARVHEVLELKDEVVVAESAVAVSVRLQDLFQGFTVETGAAEALVRHASVRRPGVDCVRDPLCARLKARQVRWALHGLKMGERTTLRKGWIGV